ncbi:retrovirus-related pol polyprotein from transposon TNT 1-94 [Tanacetum coccineum]
MIDFSKLLLGKLHIKAYDLANLDIAENCPSPSQRRLLRAALAHQRLYPRSSPLRYADTRLSLAEGEYVLSIVSHCVCLKARSECPLVYYLEALGSVCVAECQLYTCPLSSAEKDLKDSSTLDWLGVDCQRLIKANGRGCTCKVTRRSRVRKGKDKAGTYCLCEHQYLLHGNLNYMMNLNTSIKSKEKPFKDTMLGNDMRNIKMTMPRMQLNSKFVNNMLPEWSRFITEVKLNRGLKESNFDQLYAYLKQHEVHANENRTMMERFLQPTNDPLALVSNASVQQYPTQSSKSPQSSNEPSPADNFQLDSGSSSTENLIESLSNSLALLTQSYKSHLPQTNNQLRTSSNARNKATVQDGRVVVQDVRGRYNANNQGKPFQRNNARGNVVAGNVGGQNRGGIINPGPAKPIKCYNCNGLGHIARECPRPKRLQDSDYFKDKMLLMQAQENGAVLDEEQSLFLAGEQVTNFDEDVDNSPENDLALNVDHVFEADECDAFDSDENSNIIPYDQYVEDNAEHVVQCNASSVRNDALMSILDEMHEQGVQSSLTNKPDMVMNDSVTSELARYKELVGEYENSARV